LAQTLGLQQRLTPTAAMESDRSESLVHQEGRIALSVMTKVNDQSDSMIHCQIEKL
jgi:hypothetical protein